MLDAEQQVSAASGRRLHADASMQTPPTQEGATHTGPVLVHAFAAPGEQSYPNALCRQYRQEPFKNVEGFMCSKS